MRNRRRDKRNQQGQIGLLVVLLSLLLVAGVVMYVRHQQHIDVPIIESSSMSHHSEVVSSSESSSSSSVQSMASSSSESEKFDVTTVQAVFDETFATLKGEHSLYFQDMSDTAAKPLIIHNQAVRSASTIKLFILAALYEQAAKGQINLEDTYTLSEADIVGGTGNLQTQPIGTVYTLHDLAHEMIVTSDNTATNILIDRIGMAQVNAFIQQQGYTHTRLARKMLDTQALVAGTDNYIAVAEVGDLMAKLYRQQLITPQANQAMLAILKEQQDRHKLLAHLPTNTITYSKSGQFAEYGVQHDVAIIETTKGAFVLAVLSQNGEETAQQQALQQIGEAVYRLYTEE